MASQATQGNALLVCSDIHGRRYIRHSLATSKYVIIHCLFARNRVPCGSVLNLRENHRRRHTAGGEPRALLHRGATCGSGLARDAQLHRLQGAGRRLPFPSSPRYLTVLPDVSFLSGCHRDRYPPYPNHDDGHVSTTMKKQARFAKRCPSDSSE